MNGRRSDIMALFLGKEEVVGSLLDKRIISIVKQRPDKLMTEFVIRREVTEKANDKDYYRKVRALYCYAKW